MSSPTLTNLSKFRKAAETAGGAKPRGPRWLVTLIGFAAASALVGGGFWTHHLTETALREKLREGLETVLSTDVAALEIWIENELRSVNDWVQLPQLRDLTVQLVNIAANSNGAAASLKDAPQMRQLQELVQPLVDSDDYDGFGLVNREGILLAARRDEYVGQRLATAALPRLNETFSGGTFMSHPLEITELLTGLGPWLDIPRMYAIAPIHDKQNRVVAAFYLAVRPEKDFTRILSIARFGATGDTYAFDRDGRMLSDSRFDKQLKSIGLIPDTPPARSILRIQLRDPGGDMTEGYTPSTPMAGRPLTKLVAAALSGGSPSGVIITPYRDYRGVPVIGAYRWLEKYNFGVATEISVQAAFAATRPLRMAVFGLLGLLVLGAALLLVSSYALQLLRRRVEEVKQLGQYTLQRKLGSGGMGEVYLARHALLQRPTAVKFIRADQVNEANLQRFEREVQLTSQLTHPNTVEIYDFGLAQTGIFYYVMEYLPGLTLAALMELEDAIPVARVIHILKQLCASLAEAHARGLIHRDVKPLNVILTERGGYFDFVKVLDFGLVKEVSVPESDNLTAVQEVAGTPPYIAPERLRDPTCQDPRSDLFAVGVIGFNLLTGKQPFSGAGAMEIVYQVVNSPAPRASATTKREIPPALDQLIGDCLANKLEERVVSAEQIIARLEAIDTSET